MVRAFSLDRPRASDKGMSSFLRSLTGWKSIGGGSGGGGSSVPDVTTAVFYGSFAVGAQDPFPEGVFFSSDGSRMFVVGRSNDRVHQYDLSTPWDVTTAAYNSESLDVSGEDRFPSGLSFSDDGSKLFVSGYGNDSVYQYILSTEWNVTTATFDTSRNVASQDSNVKEVTFSPDGVYMYIIGSGNRRVYRYTLSTPWNVASASYDNSLLIWDEEAVPTAVAISFDGTRLYVVGSNSDQVHQYDLSTEWDLTTAVYNSEFFDVSSETGTPEGLTFSADGTKMYIVDRSSNAVFQYDLS